MADLNSIVVDARPKGELLAALDGADVEVIVARDA
jgi:hypothetical protein